MENYTVRGEAINRIGLSAIRYFTDGRALNRAVITSVRLLRVSSIRGPSNV